MRFFIRSWCKCVSFFGKFLFGVLFLYVCTCEAGTIYSTFDFIDPFEIEKLCFPRHVCFHSVGLAKSFSTSVDIWTSLAFSTSRGSNRASSKSSTDDIFCSHWPSRAQSWICCNAQVMLPTFGTLGVDSVVAAAGSDAAGAESFSTLAAGRGNGGGIDAGGRCCLTVNLHGAGTSKWRRWPLHLLSEWRRWCWGSHRHAMRAVWGHTACFRQRRSWGRNVVVNCLGINTRRDRWTRQHKLGCVILLCGTWPCRLIGGCSCWSWHGNHLAGFSSDLGAFACGCPRQSTCHIKKADVMLIVFWQSSDSPYGNGTCIILI